MRRTKQKNATDVPGYSLSEIRKLIVEGKIIIRPNARDDAFNDFGWEVEDVIEALKKLAETDFYKKDVLTSNRWVVCDYYKATGLCGEDVYTHFYISDGRLVVNSFKKI